jgi:hypothetical protein
MLAKAAKAVLKVQDIRRTKVSSVPTGGVGRLAEVPPHSIFPNKVIDPSPEETVLMGGENNSKLGGVVLRGWLKGARIVQLTMEERRTCPTSCVVWNDCYLNNMQHAKRFRHGPALLVKIDQELDVLCARGQVLVRLHGGGDFYSLDYVAFWASQIVRRPMLHVFGFTAHRTGTPIGDAIAAVRDRWPNRFAVRVSSPIRHVFKEWESYILDTPTNLARIGGATVCPEQHEAMTMTDDLFKRGTIHCGSCALCWSNSVPIIFIKH